MRFLHLSSAISAHRLVDVATLSMRLRNRRRATKHLPAPAPVRLISPAAEINRPAVVGVPFVILLRRSRVRSPPYEVFCTNAAVEREVTGNDVRDERPNLRRRVVDVPRTQFGSSTGIVSCWNVPVRSPLADKSVKAFPQRGPLRTHAAYQ